MRKYKKILIVTSLVTLLPIPVHMLLGREGKAVILLPLILLAAQWLCAFWTVKDPKNANQSPKAVTMVLWIMPVLSNLLAAVDYALAKGASFPMSKVFCLMFGILFIAIGNYMPKTRQNYTIGVKIYWTYTSEENWKATHRFAGKVWVIGGIVIALGALLPQMAAFLLMMVLVLALVLLPLGYSYWFYRGQKRRGEPLVSPKVEMKGRGKYGLVFTAALLIFVGVLMFTGDISYRYDEDSFTVEASFYDDLTLRYDEIDSLEYREDGVDGIRAWGYGSARLLMGTFQNQEFGNYTRYTYTKSGSAVVLTAQNRTIVLSGKDVAQTQALYEALREKTEK